MRDSSGNRWKKNCPSLVENARTSVYKQAMAIVHHERSQATKQRKRQGQQRSELCSPLHLVGVFDIGPRGGTVPG